MLTRALLALALLTLGWSVPASAQAAAPRVVTTCGSFSPFTSPQAGQQGWLTIDTNGNICSSPASLSAFTPVLSGSKMTQLSTTTSDSSQALPAGAAAGLVLVVSNTDTTNPIYCNLVGATATTSDQKIPANSWFAFGIPSGVPALHCIATGGTVATNGVVGSGLPAGAGGGGGGSGGGGAITGPLGTATAPSASVSVVDGGGTPITGTSMPAGGVGLTGWLSAIFAQTQTAIPAGTNSIGSVNLAANVTPTDCSGTITTGGTAQTLIAAQTTLHGFTVANIDTGSSEPLWISFTTTAAAASTQSYPIASPTATSYANLSSYTTPPGFGTNHLVSIIAATSTHKYSCTWW